MADLKIDPTIRKLWIQQALKNQEQMLRRSLGKEVPGSQIYSLREAEIQLVQQIAREFV